MKNNTCVYVCLLITIGLLLSLIIDRSEVYADDLYDTALLYDGQNIRNSDINFRVVCKYYGLKVKNIDLSTTRLTDSLFKDTTGNYYKAIAINAATLEDESPVLLDSTELSVLKDVVQKGGVNLLISQLSTSSDMYDYSGLIYLTDSSIVGANPINGNNDWIVSSSHSEISLEFTGQTISFKGYNCAHSPNVIHSATSVLSTKDDLSQEFPVFVQKIQGTGIIFVDGAVQNHNLNNHRMMDLYLPDRSGFNNTGTTMMFVRYAGGEECWHNDHDYANLTIDDPNLASMDCGPMNFEDVLHEMQIHNYHTTIGFIPRFFKDHNQAIVDLFLNYPDRYSVVQHGNNHDGYEFICYTQEQLDSLNALYGNIWADEYPRPIMEQEADIIEGKTRMSEFERLTGISYCNAMIFPFGIGLSPTLGLLKAYNFNATINGRGHPFLFLEGDTMTATTITICVRLI